MYTEFSCALSPDLSGHKSCCSRIAILYQVLDEFAKYDGNCFCDSPGSLDTKLDLLHTTQPSAVHIILARYNHNFARKCCANEKVI